jgi:hypothetical protein
MFSVLEVPHTATPFAWLELMLQFVHLEREKVQTEEVSTVLSVSEIAFHVYT